MSLKVEQKLNSYEFTEKAPSIYTTGAYLVPMKIKVGNTYRFIWVVDNFNDDSYKDGAICEPLPYADSLAALFQNDLFDDI